MCGSLKLTLALAAVAATNGQMMQGQPPSHAVSWSRSFSFFQGRDGEMHKEVREVKQMFHDGEIVQEVELDCRDTNCLKKKMTFLAPRVQPAEVLNTLMGEVRAPMPPEALLARLQAANRGMVEPEVLVVSDAPLQRQAFLDNVRMNAVPQPQRHTLSTCLKGHLLVCLAENKTPVVAFAVLSALVFASVMLIGCIVGYRSVSARERPLQDLGQPLVPEAVEEGDAEAVVAEKAVDVQPVASIKEGVSMYMARLYVRALA